MVRGFMHMIEMMVAIFWMLFFLVILTTSTTEDVSVRYQEYGYDALEDLDEQGYLRNYTLAENASGLNVALDNILPSHLNHTVRFCYLGTCTNVSLPSKDIYVAPYLMAGNETTFNVTEVLLYIWE